MADGATKVGILGCGAISRKYLENSKRFDAFDVVAVADTRLDAARERAEAFDVPKACGPDDLLADPDVEMVVNLTPHAAHGELGVAALEAGKSVYNEKPLCVRRDDGQRMLALAEEQGLRVGAAPDTFPTHFAGILDFASGAVCTLLLTSDVYDTGLPHIEGYGIEGSLRCIDPNCFGGQLMVRKPDSRELAPVDCAFGYNDNSRGVGIADMAVAARSGRPHRASGQMAYHVVDIVHALHESSDQGRHIAVASTCDRPSPLPPGLDDWTIDP